MEKGITIIRSNIVGYCMGVKRAVESAIKAVKDYPYSHIYTFGQLIHNPSTLKMLEELNVKSINETDLIGDEIKKGDVVIIRAHGVPPKIISILQEKEVIIIDSTCPRVIANRRLAEKHAENNLIILAGDKNHPELISIQGYILNKKNSRCIIIQNAEEAYNLEIPTINSNSFLIAQTTIKETEFILISNILKNKIKNLEIFNTICSATEERQNALKELINKVEAILIIGGKNSANTKRLFNTALESSTPSFFVENESDLPNEIYSFKKIGIASGASTPDEMIDKIEKTLLCK
ncbi:MAG: 4-hydroxy-3-methylbut-2-enyl diphosphate reductase [Treponema sp.]